MTNPNSPQEKLKQYLIGNQEIYNILCENFDWWGHQIYKLKGENFTYQDSLESMYSILETFNRAITTINHYRCDIEYDSIPTLKKLIKSQINSINNYHNNSPFIDSCFKQLKQNTPIVVGKDNLFIYYEINDFKNITFLMPVNMSNQDCYDIYQEIFKLCGWFI
jgi:hypothetical protein